MFSKQMFEIYTFFASQIMALVPYGGANGIDDDEQSSTDLARAWENVDLLRRRGQLLQLVPMMQISSCYEHLFLLGCA